jgi:hypothetical protein
VAGGGEVIDWEGDVEGAELAHRCQGNPDRAATSVVLRLAGKSSGEYDLRARCQGNRGTF